MSIMSDIKFDSIFDYSSVFKYQSLPPVPNSFNRNKYKSVFSYQFADKSADESTEKTKEEDRIASVLRKAITLQIYVLVFLLFPLSFWICFKKVHALERIVLMRLGKLQPVRGPGMTLVLPFIDSWTRVDLRRQCLTVTTSQVLTSDGGVVEVGAEVEYRVSDVVGSVTRVSDRERTFPALARCCLTNVVSEREQEDLEQGNREIVALALKHELNETFLRWGLEISHVTILGVKVLKCAEPSSALGTIVTALKATLGGQSTPQATAAFFPFGENVCADPATPSANEEAPEGEKGDDNNSLMAVFRKTLLLNNSSEDVSGCFRFDIAGDDPETLFCSFQNGEATLTEGGSPPPRAPDVCVTLSREDARELLSRSASPLEAYLRGRLKVTGDTGLLKPLAKVLGQAE